MNSLSNCLYRSFRQLVACHSNGFLPVIRFNNFQSLLQRESEITTLFSQKGGLILAAPTNDSDLLTRVSLLFGKIQRHTRSPNGIVEIRSHPVNESDRHVISNTSFFAHTDGAYLEGMARQGNKTFQVTAPKIIVLQCVKPAEQGGISFVVDGKAILLSMVRNHPDLISTLFSSSCINVCRERHLVMGLPVFKRLPSGRFSIRFSYDQDLHATRKTMEKIELFYEKYVSNPLFTTHFSLAERDILVLDNHRFLHGRTAILGERFLRRVWIQDEALSSELHIPKNDHNIYYGSLMRAEQTLSPYADYTAVGDTISSPSYQDFPVGIHVPRPIAHRIKRLMRS